MVSQRCYWLNVASLILGFVGNIFLLFNFTNRIRYIIALPMTIILWYLATAIVRALNTNPLYVKTNLTSLCSLLLSPYA